LEEKQEEAGGGIERMMRGEYDPSTLYEFTEM
jgi:hypothetical protein